MFSIEMKNQKKCYIQPVKNGGQNWLINGMVIICLTGLAVYFLIKSYL